MLSHGNVWPVSLHSNAAEGIGGTSGNRFVAKAKVANEPGTCVSGPRCNIKGMEPLVSPTISRGAIASVLCTVIGAIALTAGFGVAIPSVVVRFSPRGSLTADINSLTADIKVSWAENEGDNSQGGRKASKSITDSHKDFFVIEISRADLGFEAIAIDAEGWPPDLAGGYQNGLVSYSIKITVKRAADLLPTTSDCFIARSPDTAWFYVLVPRSGTLFSESKYKGGEVFRADAQGVVNIATAERRDGSR